MGFWLWIQIELLSSTWLHWFPTESSCSLQHHHLWSGGSSSWQKSPSDEASCRRNLWILSLSYTNQWRGTWGKIVLLRVKIVLLIFLQQNLKIQKFQEHWASCSNTKLPALRITYTVPFTTHYYVYPYRIRYLLLKCQRTSRACVCQRFGERTFSDAFSNARIHAHTHLYQLAKKAHTAASA